MLARQVSFCSSAAACIFPHYGTSALVSMVFSQYRRAVLSQKHTGSSKQGLRWPLWESEIFLWHIQVQWHSRYGPVVKKRVQRIKRLLFYEFFTSRCNIIALSVSTQDNHIHLCPGDVVDFNCSRRGSLGDGKNTGCSGHYHLSVNSHIATYYHKEIVLVNSFLWLVSSPL